MVLLNPDNLSLAWLSGRIGFPDYSLSLIAKATFDLNHEKRASISAEQPPCMGDVAYEDAQDNAGSALIRYPSDFVPAKPKADCIVVGTCYPKNGIPTPMSTVKISVGSLSQVIRVTGDRVWKIGALTSVLSEAETFTTMPLRWDKAFGGPGYKANPSGKGYRPVKGPEGQRIRQAPNLEYPGDYMKSVSSRPKPACYAPIPISWSERATKAGSYNAKWVKQRWPAYANDMDWTFFNAAPAVMQVKDYFRGDEPLAFENMHPEHSMYRTYLPSMKARCFIHDRLKSDSDQLREVPMNLDTLWVDMDTEQLVLVWRGVVSIVDEYFDELTHIMAFLERIEAPTSAANSKLRFSQLITAYEEGDEIDDDFADDFLDVPASSEEQMDEQVRLHEKQIHQQQLLALHQQMIEAGIEPDNPPELTAQQELDAKAILKKLREKQAQDIGIPIDLLLDNDDSNDLDNQFESQEKFTREKVILAVKNGQSLAEADLSGLDLSHAELAGGEFSGAIFTNSLLNNSNLSNCTLIGADIAGVNLTNTNLNSSNLCEADFTDAVMTDALLTGAQLTGAIFERATLERVRADAVEGEGGSFVGADLSESIFARAQLAGADFTGAKLTFAIFADANLVGATFERCNAQNVCFERANLKELRAAGPGDFTNAKCSESAAMGSIWTENSMSCVDFRYSQLSQSDFSRSSLKNADFSAAIMRESRFVKADLTNVKFIRTDMFESTLEKANLTNVDAGGASMYGSEFLDACIDGLHAPEADLTKTKLAGRRYIRRAT